MGGGWMARHLWQHVNYVADFGAVGDGVGEKWNSQGVRGRHHGYSGSPRVGGGRAVRARMGGQGWKLRGLRLRTKKNRASVVEIAE